MIRTLALLLAASLSAPVAAAAPGRNYTVTSFDRVRVEGPYAVTLKTNVAPFARAEGTPAQIDAIDLRVEGRTLIIRKHSSAAPSGAGGPVRITVGTPDLRTALLSGAGQLSIDKLKGLNVDVGVQGSGSLMVADVQADRLGAMIEGSGQLLLAGKAKTVSLAARGTPTLQAPSLTASDLTVNAHGAAEVSAHPLVTASVNASGTARVQLSGSAACTLRVAGSAEVTGCGKIR